MMLFMVAVSMAVKLLELLSSPMLRMSLSLSLVCFTVDNDSITKILYSQITRESGGSGLNFNVLFVDYYFS